MQQASLEQLNDIVEPGAASLWPPAWPLIAITVALLSVLMVVIWWLLRRYRLQRPQRLALAKLELLSNPSAGDITLLCKQVALAYFPREHIASLSGRQWLHFLGATTQHHNTLLEQSDALFFQPAQGELIKQYQLLAKQWIRNARRHAKRANTLTAMGGRHV